MNTLSRKKKGHRGFDNSPSTTRRMIARRLIEHKHVQNHFSIHDGRRVLGMGTIWEDHGQADYESSRKAIAKPPEFKPRYSSHWMDSPCRTDTVKLPLKSLELQATIYKSSRNEYGVAPLRRKNPRLLTDGRSDKGRLWPVHVRATEAAMNTGAMIGRPSIGLGTSCRRTWLPQPAVLMGKSSALLKRKSVGAKMLRTARLMYTPRNLSVIAGNVDFDVSVDEDLRLFKVAPMPVQATTEAEK
ncbi:hypothetical protein KIN20_009570 [Parelaphostrongylus tenuis]|uniref:Uncharacterized protein n=1 Tax=Parelaphostrongylus tenuis TaxID=148309 RepID=A0AAD5M8D2_PARTN|nr:hypothetical protein KIN20_009570 [Parelaphostrongylus tenuis]